MTEDFKSRKFRATEEDIQITAFKEYVTFQDRFGLEMFHDDKGCGRYIGDHIGRLSRMEIVPEPTTPALQIEEGKFYITRDGRKVGPIQEQGHKEWPFDLNHFKQRDLEDDLACTLWDKNGKSVDKSNLDLISEYKEPEIKVGDLYTFVGEESCFFESGAVYTVKQISKTIGYTQIVTNNSISGQQHYWKDSDFNKFFRPAYAFGTTTEIKSYAEYNQPPSPIQTTTVNKIISGDYGRLRISSDGYHSLNLSIIDGKSRCVSVDEMREMIDLLSLIVEARGNK